MTPTSTASRARCPDRAGFTLIELMIVIAIIGLAMSVSVTGSGSLLPQTRLRSSATTMAAALEMARSHAQLRQEPLVFAYDLDLGTFEAYYPFERDEHGVNKGPGKTPVIDAMPLEEGMEIRSLRLPGSLPREDGIVALEISPLGRVPPHEVVIDNPEYPETEVLTLRVSGLANRSQILKGDVVMAPLQDVDFR
jgi:prepilin-type N-terminal cleavage/methylation domain-containing protein